MSYGNRKILCGQKLVSLNVQVNSTREHPHQGKPRVFDTR